MNLLTFRPRDRFDLPVLCVDEVGREFRFVAYTSAGSAEIETYHATFTDALRVAARSIDNYGGVYDIEAPTVKQIALNEAAAYLRKCVERMREQQKKDYRGDRGGGIAMLLRLAREIKELP